MTDAVRIRDRVRASAGRSWETIAGMALAGPATLLLLGLFLLPTASVFAISMTDWQFGANRIAFIGLKNYDALWADKLFHQSLTNTVIYTAIVVPGTVLLGLLIALLIESGKTFRNFYQAVHFLPYMATMAAMAIAWEALLHPTVGLVNRVIGLAGFSAVNWLRDEGVVLSVLAVLGIWQNLGFAMVLFLAGLRGIPRELYEAADMDGADGIISRFTTITMPMLGPVTMFVVIVSALKTIQVFDTVRILTKGGPANASEVLLHTLYVESFEFLRTGYGAAITVVFLGIVVVLTLAQARSWERRVHYT